ncbi:MAG: hypothetical protein R6U04_05420 [Bacteroidales bacterium]
MDIEKLKGSWKKYTSEFQSRHFKNADDLDEILEKKSQQSLRLLKRNFFIEAGLNILLIPIILLVFVKSGLLEGTLNVVFTAIIFLILLVFLSYLYGSYRKIYKYENYNLSLKEKLEQQIDRLESFTRYYYKFLYVAYFIALIVGLSFDLPDDNTKVLFIVAIGAALGLLLFFIVVRPLAKMYVNKLYKRHILSLKQCLRELEE